MTETFTIAVVGSPFGIKGFVKVLSLSGEISHLETLKSVNIRQGDKEKVLFIEEIMPFGGNSREAGQYLLMKFQGIDTPEAVSSLKGSTIIVHRSQAAPLKKGEYYIEDLKGLKVITQQKQCAANLDCRDSGILGHITNILEGGNGKLAEIRLFSGEIKLVPFRNEFFGDINLENGYAVLLESWILE